MTAPCPCATCELQRQVDNWKAVAKTFQEDAERAESIVEAARRVLEAEADGTRAYPSTDAVGRFYGALATMRDRLAAYDAPSPATDAPVGVSAAGDESLTFGEVWRYWQEAAREAAKARAELAAAKQECDGWVEKYASLVAAAARDANALRAELAAAKQECERLRERCVTLNDSLISTHNGWMALRAANGRLTEALRRLLDGGLHSCCGLGPPGACKGCEDEAFARAALSATSQPSGGAGVEKDGDKQ